MGTESIDLQREHLATAQAAQRVGLSRAYIALLLRQGSLEGFKIGRERFVYTDSLNEFIATPRKPGPRGPRKLTTVSESKST